MKSRVQKQKKSQCECESDVSPQRLFISSYDQGCVLCIPRMPSALLVKLLRHQDIISHWHIYIPQLTLFPAGLAQGPFIFICMREAQAPSQSETGAPLMFWHRGKQALCCLLSVGTMHRHWALECPS